MPAPARTVEPVETPEPVLQPTPRRRIVFIDVDGTLVEHDILDPSAPDAIRAVRNNGHLVYLATGRAASDIAHELFELGFDGVISNGGSYARKHVYSAGPDNNTAHATELISQQLMPRELVKRLVTYFQAEKLPFLLQADDALYASEEIEAVFADFWRQRIADRIAEAERLGVTLKPEDTVEIEHAERFRQLSDADFDNVAKAVFVSSDEDAVERARAALGEEFDVVPGSMPRPMIGEHPAVSGEIAPRGVTKGAAIQAVLEHLGIDPADAIGIGDSWNDIEMFAVCGVAVAMGNAHPAVQEFADRTTTPVLHGGVRNALADLGLI